MSDNFEGNEFPVTEQTGVEAITPLAVVDPLFNFDVAVEKTDEQDEVLPGDTLTYKITVTTDAGDDLDDATYVTVYDVLDPNVELVSVTGGGIENTDDSTGIPEGAIQWDLGTLPPGTTVELEVTVQVKDTAPEGVEIVNSAHVGRLHPTANNGEFYEHTFDNDKTNNTATDTTIVDDGAPSMEVTKWADPATVAEGGDTVTFHVLIENKDGTGGDEDPLTIIHLFDTIKDGDDPDNLPDQIDLMATALQAWQESDPSRADDTEIVIPVGESFEFTFEREVTVNAYAYDSDHVTVGAVTDDLEDDFALEAVADIDGAAVMGTNVLPSIVVTKSSDGTVLEGGEAQEYTIIINNTSVSTDPVTVTSLMDDKFGNLLPEAIEQNGDAPIVIAPGGTYSFTVVRDVNINVGETHTNIVTVKAEDDEESEAEGSDSDDVTATDVLPIIDIDKGGDMQVDEGTGMVTYTLTITNGSVATDPLTITHLFDDKFGDLLAEAEAENGGPIVIQPGEIFEFSFERELELDAEELHANVVTVVAKDDEGNVVDAFDCHVVEAVDVAPEISVGKTSDGLIAEGGEMQEFTITITNESGSTDPVKVTEIMDSVFGDLMADALAAWGGEGPIMIAPEGGMFTFSFWRPTDIGNAADLDKHVNAVKVTVVDDEGTEGSAIACHVAEAEDVAPTITVEKSSDGEVEAGGDTQEYTVTIKNTSGETDPVKITSIEDDMFTETDLFAIALQAYRDDQGDQSLDAIWIDPDTEFSFTFSGEVVLEEGETHVNTVTVEATDDEGFYVAEAQDDDTVVAVAPTPLEGGYLTDGSLCDMGECFDLNFVPVYEKCDDAEIQRGGEHDGKRATEYRLESSTPPVVVYNLFFDAAELDTPGMLTVNIPFPFVLTGENAIEAYTDVTVDEECGAFCFQPAGEEIEGFSYEQGDAPDANGATYTIDFTDLPAEGFVYLAIELEYGLVDSSPWKRFEGDDALYNADDEDIAPIFEGTEHAFSADGIEGSEDSIWNDNEFEGPKWMHGGGDRDKMKGGKQDERMFGYGGDDNMKGNKGDDYMVGGSGDDKLKGGRGEDTFVFEDKGGRDVVKDFDAKGSSHDFIDVSELSCIKGWKDLVKNHLEEHKGGALIEGDGVEIYLKGVDCGELDKGEFLFG